MVALTVQGEVQTWLERDYPAVGVISPWHDALTNFAAAAAATVTVSLQVVFDDAPHCEIRNKTPLFDT